MGLVYLPTCVVDFYGINVGKYTSPMDAMEYGFLVVSQGLRCSNVHFLEMIGLKLHLVL